MNPAVLQLRAQTTGTTGPDRKLTMLELEMALGQLKMLLWGAGLVSPLLWAHLGNVYPLCYKKAPGSPSLPAPSRGCGEGGPTLWSQPAAAFTLLVLEKDPQACPGRRGL